MYAYSLHYKVKEMVVSYNLTRPEGSRRITKKINNSDDEKYFLYVINILTLMIIHRRIKCIDKKVNDSVEKNK